jgi:hypothetical protein
MASPRARTDRAAERTRMAAPASHRQRGIALAVALATGAPAALALPAVTADFADRWIRPDAVLTLRLDPTLAARASDLRLFAGTIDVSALVRQPQPGVVAVDLRAVRPPPGESQLRVFVVDGASWREVATLPLRVLTPAGLESGRFEPKLDIANKTRFESGTRGDAAAPSRSTFSDFTGRAAVGFEAVRGAFRLDGTANGVGSSYRGEALRFAELAEQAPKGDLADYAVNLRYGGTTLALGHQAIGSLPLVLAGYDTRGVTLGQKFGQRLDLSLGAANGTRIVGYDNFLGLQRAEHRIYSAAAGLELIGDSPGALRLELALLDARMQARENFNQGEVADAERSRALGVRLTGRTPGNRLRGDASFARSSHVNPFDPLLAQGAGVKPVERRSANGRRLEAALDVVQASKRWSEKHPLTLTLALQHARIEPLYRTVGNELQADRQQDRASLTAQVGAAQLQLAGERAGDNLDRIATLLRTRTDTASANLLLPFGQWFAAADGRSWWPQLAYTAQTVRQRAVNAPATVDSGFADSQRPDQLDRTHQATLNLARGTWSVAYVARWSRQDNRQPGRQDADFDTRGHEITVTLQAGESLNLTIGGNVNRTDNREKDLATSTRGGTGGFDWRVSENWSIAANAGRTLGGDSRDLAASSNVIAQAQLAWRFSVAAASRRLPGQVFVRYVRQDNSNRDSTFGLATRGGTWAWDAGVSLSLD